MHAFSLSFFFVPPKLLYLHLQKRVLFVRIRRRAPVYVFCNFKIYTRRGFAPAVFITHQQKARKREREKERESLITPGQGAPSFTRRLCTHTLTLYCFYALSLHSLSCMCFYSTVTRHANINIEKRGYIRAKARTPAELACWHA